MQEHTTIIGKILTPVKRSKFKRIVQKYKGDFAVKKLSCWEQFIAIFLGQITNCSSLREIESIVKYHSNQQYHLGLRKDVARSTLAKANEVRDWHIYYELFVELVGNLKPFEQKETKNVIKLIDSTPIMLDLNQHKWAEKTQRIKGLKVHLMYDLQEKIPVYFEITGAKTSDITTAKTIKLIKGTTYVFDKGYTDYNWWKEIDNNGAFFVTRLKNKAKIKELSEVKETNKIIGSQLICLASKKVHHKQIVNEYYGKTLKKVVVKREGKEPLILVTNDLRRSDEEIAELYKKRWQIELFFKWIKQNLKIKKFLGKSENAIKTQICIAMISFVLLRLMEELKEICVNMPLRMLEKIVGNNLFNCLKVREYGRKKWKDPNQLQFCWAFSP